MNELIRQFKFFWPWQDQAQEKWLEEQSQSGYHLEKPNTLLGVYTFKTGDPESYAYRLDFQSDLKNEPKAYIQIFEDAGWEYLGESSWQYFRKPYQEDSSHEIFSNNQSKIKKYKRLVLYLSTFLAILTLLFMIGGGIEGDLAWLSHFFTIIFVPTAIFFAVSILKITFRIKMLKAQIKD